MRKRRDRPGSSKDYENRLHSRSNSYSSYSQPLSLTRLGSTNDIGIRDVTLSKPVSWQTESVPANIPGEADVITKRLDKGRTGNVESLKQISAKSVALHSRDISKILLKSDDWNSAWKLVWKWICDLGLDSYPLFGLFVKEFSKERDFHCHHRQTTPITSGSESKRDKFLDSWLLPNAKHRIEYIARGAISGIAENINKYNIGDYIVTLDLSGLTIPDLSDFSLNLTSLKNLSALDVSNTGVVTNNNVLTLWKLAITSGMWKNSLKMLCLGDGQLDEVGLSIYKSLFATSLVYIEGPAVVNDDWIHGRRVKGISSRFTTHYSLPFKYQFLCTRPIDDRVRLKRSVVVQEFIIGRTDECWIERRLLNSQNCYVRKEIGQKVEIGQQMEKERKMSIRKSKIRILDKREYA